MSSNWPIDGKISKALKKSYVYPETKYINEKKDDDVQLERNKSPNERNRESFSREKGKEERPQSNERNREKSPNSEKNKTDNNTKNKISKNNKTISNSKEKKTHNCCSKSCGNFIRMPLW